VPTMNTKISWTTSTWNPTTGCTKVSGGCDHCYAEAISQRFGRDFSIVTLHPGRLKQASKFTPLVQEDRSLLPRLVFVNSMSDLMHEAVPDSFRHQVFDIIDQMPETVFQILTKRAMTMGRFIAERYKAGVPSNLWLGASVENNQVRGRIGQLRRLKDTVGDYTAFLSVEPLIGPVDKHDYTGMAWIVLGGESGPKARPCHLDWVRTGRDEARRVGAAVFFKQWGRPANNPLVKQRMERHVLNVRDAWEMVVKLGLELLPSEKGGGTLDGEVLHELPPAYHALARKLNSAV
jgi:protein gp37